MKNAHSITKDFEAALCEYTGAPYAVVVNSCTMALLLAVRWCIVDQVVLPSQMDHYGTYPLIEIPKRTYVSVPMSIIHAGGFPVFRDENWRGAYQLKPMPVWDCARRFTMDMWLGMNSLHPNPIQCVSFHASKILGDTQGGAILHDNQEADSWLRRARFDGRTEGVAPADDKFDIMGWHCYISPDVSARLLQKLSVLPAHNDPLPNDDYPDLSLIKWEELM